MQTRKRGDVALILRVLLAASSIYGVKWLKTGNEQYKQGELMALITVDGKPYKTVPLTRNSKSLTLLPPSAITR